MRKHIGIFNRLKNLFGGEGRQEPDTGIYLYVQLDRTGEVVQLRLTPEHELVPDYEHGGYFTRKTIVGPRRFERAEATFTFDDNRQLTGADISGGTLVDRAAWETWQAQEDERRRQAAEEPPAGDEA